MSEDAPKDKAVAGSIPDPEVRVDETKKRRNLTAQYKLRILAEAEACKDNPGELGALLRREGLYSSHLSAWRSDRKQGKLSATSETKRGPKRALSEIEAENLELRKERDLYKLKYEQGQKLIEAQKKIAEIFETAAREEVSLKTRRGKP
jgi:transposase-like protein